jgi:esterase/lipase
MKTVKLSGKHFTLFLVLAMVAFLGVGCDDDVCTDNISGIGRTAGARLYYPCDISSPAGATSMTSGYMGTLSDVQWLSNDLAEAGYIVLAFTPANTLGMVEQWKEAHKNCISRLKQLNTTHSKLKGLIDTGKLSTCGHSKGGGGSLWASSELGSQLKTTVGMAPWMEGFIPATLGSIKAATFIQAGSLDTLATASMTRSEYNGLGNISKCYKTYSGYDHLAWATATGNRASTLSGDIIDWMKYYLDGVGSPPSGCTGGDGCN